MKKIWNKHPLDKKKFKEFFNNNLNGVLFEFILFTLFLSDLFK
jgi:hypothetical protein